MTDELSLTFDERRTLYGDAVGEFLETLMPLGLLVENYDDVQDQLMARATSAFLSEQEFDVEDIHESRIDSGDVNTRTLLIPGGDFHRRNGRVASMTVRASEQFETVVILPSTFNLEVPEVIEALSLPNVFAFARDQESFDEVSGTDRASLAYDLLLFDRAFEDPPTDASRNKVSDNILVSLRSDEFGSFSRSGLQVDHEIHSDLLESSKSVDELIEAVRAADIVVTDQLVVAVIAVMTGSYLYVAEPRDQKIGAYLSYVFRDEIASSMESTSPRWLVNHGFVVTIVN